MTAIRAQGTVFQMTISSVLTAIAHVVGIDGPDSTREDIDVTDLSSGAWREFLAGLIDGGEVALRLNFDPDGATHQALTDQFILTTNVACKLIFSDTTEWPLTCYIKRVGPSIETGGKAEASVTFKVASAITYPS